MSCWFLTCGYDGFSWLTLILVAVVVYTLGRYHGRRSALHDVSRTAMRRNQPPLEDWARWKS